MFEYILRAHASVQNRCAIMKSPYCSHFAMNVCLLGMIYRFKQLSEILHFVEIGMVVPHCMVLDGGATFSLHIMTTK